MLKRLSVLAPLLITLPSLPGQSSDVLPLDPRNPAISRTGELIYLGGLSLTHSDGRFGGISGLRFVDDRFVAVTDQGSWLTFLTEENASGRLQAITRVTFAPLKDAAGLKLTGAGADAEAVARARDGGLLVSFERHHRILHFTSVSANGFVYAYPPVAGISSNGGYEAMTTLADGSIIGIAERNRASDDHLTGFASGNGGRNTLTFRLKRRDGFRPTDMVQMPDGDLLLLERYFKAPGTVAARVSRIGIRDIKQDAMVIPRTLATIRQPALVDNMEGMAIRPAPDGGLWLYLVSDDNFNPLQRTILMKFAYYPKR